MLHVTAPVLLEATNSTELPYPTDVLAGKMASAVPYSTYSTRVGRSTVAPVDDELPASSAVPVTRAVSPARGSPAGNSTSDASAYCTATSLILNVSSCAFTSVTTPATK